MSGSGDSGRRGDARRRRRSADPETERFRGDDPLQRDDAWRTWLDNHGRQRDESLPGPFVTSVSRVPMSPTQAMEGGLQPPGLGNSNGGAQLQAVGPGLDAMRAHEVLVDDSLPSLSTPPGQTGTNGQTNVETQLLQISQALVSLRSDLQSQIGRTFGALERRLEQVETGNTVGNPVRNQGVLRQGPSDVFGQQYSGDGDCSFNRIGSPIRRQDRGHGSSGDTARHRDVSNERDVLSRSEKWLPSPPVPNTSTWRDRETEITGFFKYIQSLRAWSQLAS